MEEPLWHCSVQVEPFKDPICPPSLDSQNFELLGQLAQMAPQTSWLRDMPADRLESGNLRMWKSRNLEIWEFRIKKHLSNQYLNL